MLAAIAQASGSVPPTEPASTFDGSTTVGVPAFADGEDARHAAEELIATYIESEFGVEVTDAACSVPPAGAVGDEFACYALKPGNLVIALRATVGEQRLIELELLVDQQTDRRRRHHLIPRSRRAEPAVATWRPVEPEGARPPHGGRVRCRPGMETRPVSLDHAAATPPPKAGRARQPGARRHLDRAPPPRPVAVRRSLQGHLERGFRPDIEGLRAIAVIAVIAFHVRAPGVSGGFVGVDVFFVVSGFLITRLILGELATSGTISLRTFWGRRARRLLPASTLTVVVTVLFAQQMLPPLSLRSLATDAIAAGTFTINFVFAHRLGDYFGAQLGSTNPSPLLHYWSLAVEEQFYLCWPPLLVVLARRPRQYRRLVLATIAVLATASFVVGLWLTASRPSWAFFLLPARMGELLAGAALAVVGTSITVIPARLAGRPGLGRDARHRGRLLRRSTRRSRGPGLPCSCRWWRRWR